MGYDVVIFWSYILNEVIVFPDKGKRRKEYSNSLCTYFSNAFFVNLNSTDNSK
jgi:putative flippase GtrA